ncbi:unnamed protein product [Clonostachys rhizophaga]|uniref:Uncharacterized protein n=1 Tax=Clonostachys rhizophaga TaxID=160324 RepID=A0A9N9YPS3_9HYPO|nr:unnamed protein product [Clonostachys rhizophaga]
MGFDIAAAREEGYLPPDWTDEQIIETFTPAEHRFYEWEQSGHCIRDFGIGNMEQGLRDEFPDVENVEHQHWVFMYKWGDRFFRRWAQPVPAVNVLEIIKETNCRDPESVSSTSLTLQVGRVPDMLLGESSFGGVLTGYAVAIDPTFLQPDTTNSDLRNGPTDMELDSAVIAIDINSPPPDIQPESLQLISPPQKRRRESNSSEESSDKGSDMGSNVSMRSATSDDFMGKEPHVFFQLGELMACTGFDWLAVRDDAPEEAAKYAEWEETGYSVLVKLDRRGYPTGPIFVAYAFCRHDGFEAEEIEWRDGDDRELPHIRRLYEDCKIQFYLAQIANGIEDLKHGKEFNFDVKCFDRCTVQGAKVVGFNPVVKVVPRGILADEGEDKRAQMADD